jgi:UDP-N-acetylmuramoyl-L-alanyl-D-glutamate--2,6-diaminopimelate ligase
MKLRELLHVLPEFAALNSSAESEQDVTDICADSRQVQKNSVFVAIPGHVSDGHQFLPAVCLREPLAVVVERNDLVPADYKGVVVVVKNSRQALDLLASTWNGDPSQKLFLFGVTGTNGKTSCTYLFEHIFNSVGLLTGVIGTINHHIGETTWAAETTTPDPLLLQKRLSEMKALGAKTVAMEISSHALDQRRADSVHFNVVLFTNLTRDHLDYHKDMKHYFFAKQRLFTDFLHRSIKIPQFAIINTDDSYGRRLRIAGAAGLWTYGQSKSADFSFRLLSGDFSATQFHLRTPFGDQDVSIPLCGLHNIYNAVGVMAAAASLGVPLSYSIRALQTFTGVPGRLQRVNNGRGIHVFIDYAHSPDALENVLSSLQRVRQQGNIQNRIFTVFGCGGDRDKGKRPQMAQIAEKNSDVVIVTSDNPRSEDPMAIIADILHGFHDAKPYIEVDRRKAIQMALEHARSGDVVVIAGKGHEDYQIIGQEKIHFSDLETAQEILA